MNPTLRSQLSALATEGRASGLLDPTVDERSIALTFNFEGRTWGAHADTLIERLVDLAEAIDAGRARQRVTDKGTVGLWDGRIDHLYVYEVGGHVEPKPVRVEEPCPRCYLVHGGECDR